MEPDLASGNSDVWNSLVTAANPASLLVAIACRMGPELRQVLDPEDLWQETLLKAWQARQDFVWQGTPSFRRWLLTIAFRCIGDQRDRSLAKRRDSTRTASLRLGGTGGGGSSRPPGVEPFGSTTPSRIAFERERARAMERAILSLPDDVRDVVRLRLFEDLPIGEIASTTGLGDSAVRRGFRKGAELYRKALKTFMEPSSLEGPRRIDGPAAEEASKDSVSRDAHEH
jgi:RNA polymerase sigma factor (sigma-70 family)